MFLYEFRVCEVIPSEQFWDFLIVFFQLFDDDDGCYDQIFAVPICDLFQNGLFLSLSELVDA